MPDSALKPDPSQQSVDKPTDSDSHRGHIEQLSAALLEGKTSNVRKQLQNLHPAEIAHVLEALPRVQRNAVWKLTNPEDDGGILLEVNDEVREGLIQQMDTSEVVEAFDGVAIDDLADVIENLPDDATDQILEAMSEQQRTILEAVVSYDENCAGGLMDTDVITVRPDVTLDVVQRFLRMRRNIPAGTDALFVVDRNGKYRGVLSLSTLLTEQPSQHIAEVMDSTVKPILDSASSQKVISRFEDHDLLSAAVVNEENLLMGRITVDDVLDAVREEAEHSILGSAGLDEEADMFAPIVRSARKRGVWLGINLLTALLAAWVVGLFQATINEVVALAVLMPVVASMGGITGSQTLTLVIRGQALEQISRSNARQFLRREIIIGAMNAVVWSTVIAVIAIFWFDSPRLGGIIAAAIVVNMIFAGLAGFWIPIILRKLKIDPALAGSVVLTTVTDVVGFWAFLGLGALILT
jgi:magnesium transporter